MTYFIFESRFACSVVGRDAGVIWHSRVATHPSGCEPVICSAGMDSNKGAFSSKIFWLLATVALSFVFDKNYPIIDYLGLKDSSR